MIRHILLMKFSKDITNEKLLEIQDGFMHIPILIQGVISVEWGSNNSPEDKNAGYTHCALLTFMDEQTREIYLNHPAHLALKKIFRPVLLDIIVFDF